MSSKLKSLNRVQRERERERVKGAAEEKSDLPRAVADG